MNFSKFIVMAGLMIGNSLGMEEEATDSKSHINRMFEFDPEIDKQTILQYRKNHKEKVPFSTVKRYEDLLKEHGAMEKYDSLPEKDISKTYVGNAISSNLYVEELRRTQRGIVTEHIPNFLPCLPFCARYNQGVGLDTIQAASDFGDFSIIVQYANDFSKNAIPELKLHTFLFGKKAGDLNENIPVVKATISHFMGSSFDKPYTITGNVHVHDGIASPNNFGIKLIDVSKDFNALKVVIYPVQKYLNKVHKSLLILVKEPLINEVGKDFSDDTFIENFLGNEDFRESLSKEPDFSESTKKFLNKVIPAFLSEDNSEQTPNLANSAQSHYQNNNDQKHTLPQSMNAHNEMQVSQNTPHLPVVPAKDHYNKGTHRSARGAFLKR